MTMGKVAALFIDKEGIYPDLLTPDLCWDEERNAFTYHERYPVVAHPPCNLWGKFAMINFGRWGGEHNRPGNDGGKFKFALDTVRKCGGVLEHPATSKAWESFKIPKAVRGRWTQTLDGEWVTVLDQAAYGHLATKTTQLLYRGFFKPWDCLWEPTEGSHQIGFHDQRGKGRNKPTLSGRNASATPKKFAEFLISLAHRSVYGR